MAIDGVSGNKETQKAQKTDGQKKTLSKDYQTKQKILASQIKDQPNSVNDLKSNAKIKKEQITLAKQYGDTKLANTLQKELEKINNDIDKNETSIFDKN